jgi:hypothetical protein
MSLLYFMNRRAVILLDRRPFLVNLVNLVTLIGHLKALAHHENFSEQFYKHVISDKPPSKKAQSCQGERLWEVLRGPWAQKGFLKQEDANPAAASSSDESDNEPQSANVATAPPQTLAQPKNFGEKPHA